MSCTTFSRQRRIEPDRDWVQFDPLLEAVGTVPGIRDWQTIRDEPMVFNGDYKFAIRNGGPLTREIMEALTQSSAYGQAFDAGLHAGLNIVVDTRVTMTMKNDYPSRPGWHCDDVPRGEKYSQPDLSKRTGEVMHFQCNIASGRYISNTQYWGKSISMFIDPKNVWNSVDDWMLRYGNSDKAMVENIPGVIYQFNQSTLHRAMPTLEPGWRMFFRLSFTHKKPANEIRNQVQIYTRTGW